MAKVSVLREDQRDRLFMLPTVRRAALSLRGSPECPICGQACAVTAFESHVRYAHNRAGQYAVAFDSYLLGAG